MQGIDQTNSDIIKEILEIEQILADQNVHNSRKNHQSDKIVNENNEGLKHKITQANHWL